MGVIRGKVWGPDSYTGVAHVGGPWPYVECECGRDLDPKTGKHVEWRSLQEVLDEIDPKPKCPDAQASDVQDRTK